MSYPLHAISLAEFTIDELKPLLTINKNLFPDNLVPKITKKDDFVNSLSSLFSSQEVLKKFYRTLSTLEQSTLQEIVHTSNGHFYPEQITAKYGTSPKMRVSYRDKDTQISPLAALLSKANTLPLDLLLRLKGMIPSPKKTAMQGLHNLPETFSIQKRSSTQDLPLIIHETEAAALSDLTALLALCENGSISVGETTGNVSTAGAAKIQAMLSSGDFYDKNETAPDSYDTPFGTLGIRSFAWPLLLQAGKIAKVEKNKLVFSKSGKKALHPPKHEVISDLFEAWLTYKDFHELSRIDVFKGQKSKGHPLYKASPAREMIAQALAELPSEKWVLIDDFFSFIIASKLNFEIAKNPWALYISDPEYGSLGYNHIKWRHINGRFTLAFLLEYAATLGIIDVAITRPWGSIYDYSDFWGTDDLSCLSRYDGLKYIRLTKLGEWILKEEKNYTGVLSQPVTQFQISENLEFTLFSDKILPSNKMIIDRLCDPISDRVWSLSKNKLLKLIEQGATILEIKEKISSLISQEALPDSMIYFLEDLDRKNNQLILKGTCTLIECQDIEMASLIANSKDLKKFTFLLNDKLLVILKGHEESFCKAIKKLGLLPPSKLEGAKK